MDKSALKDKRRETVIGLLKGMNIKTEGEGFDKDNVYQCIQELTNLYEEHIDELEKNYEAEINDLTKKYHKYDENNDLYVSLIMEAKKSSNDIISQAKSEVEEILNSGRKKVELQERQIEQLQEDGKREKESIAAELKATKDVAEAEIAAMRVEIEAEKEKLEATKNKYRQHITSMEDEFAEIKTNILRTAARLDTLKAQVEEVVPAVEWDVEPAKSVQMPAADLEVDDILDAIETQEPTFEETFFKSDIFMPASVSIEPEPIIEETSDLSHELDLSHEEDEIQKNEIETLLDEITFDDILDDGTVAEPSESTEEIEEISLEELVSLEPTTAEEHEEELIAKPDSLPDEISFDSLEALFKDEK